MSDHLVRSVARQASGLLIVQVVLLLTQLGYTAITSRLFAPSEFGAYAAASATVALGSLLTVNGFAKSTARRPDDSTAADRQILGLALFAAASLAAIVAISAPWLAALWGNAQATLLIRVMSLSIVAAAYAGVLSGVVRRLGRMRTLTLASLTAGLLGVAAGAAVTVILKEPWTLAVLPVSTPVFLGLLLAWRLAGTRLPAVPRADSVPDLRFAVNSSGTSVVSYFTFTVPLWVLSRVAGPDVLGAWNRAVALTQVPVETAVRAWSTAAFPHFRKADGSPDPRPHGPNCCQGALAGHPGIPRLGSRDTRRCTHPPRGSVGRGLAYGGVVVASCCRHSHCHSADHSLRSGRALQSPVVGSGIEYQRDGRRHRWSGGHCGLAMVGGRQPRCVLALPPGECSRCIPSQAARNQHRRPLADGRVAGFSSGDCASCWLAWADADSWIVIAASATCVGVFLLATYAARRHLPVLQHLRR
ncbi:MAG: oligosaccharide flippase family protein [Micrococcales bacterium]|nr:oligosaccharide flippase family protein [Micrococcales bacterium]